MPDTILFHKSGIVVPESLSFNLAWPPQHILEILEATAYIPRG
ncbi:hypothetical protein [Alteromonas sp. H39]